MVNLSSLKIRMIRGLFIFLGFSCLLTFANGQSKNVKFRNLGVKDGLSHSWVKSIEKDNRGFIWIGTLTGLNRYDGYTFKVFKHDDANPRSIGDNQVARIFEDSKNRLWVSNSNSGFVNLYNPDGEDFEVYRLPGKDLLDANLGHIATDGPIFEDSQGNLWVGTEFGVTLYDSVSNTFQQYTLKSENKDIPVTSAVYSIAEDQNGTLWFGTLNGVLTLNLQTRAVKTYTHGDDPNSLSNPLVRTIFVDENGDIWLGTWGGGLNLYDAKNDNFIHFRYNPKDPGGISSDALLDLEGDNEGRLYIGTENGGLNILDLETYKIEVLSTQIDYDFSLSSNSIYSVFHDDETKILWLGTFNGGVDYTSPWSKAFIHHKAQFTRLNNNKITDLQQDHLGNIWIGTDGGGVNVRGVDGSYTYYQHNPGIPGSLMSNAVLAILNDKTQKTWIGTYSGGLDLLDRQKGTFTHFRNNPLDPTSLGGLHVSSIYEDGNGDIWVGMFDAGISILDKSSGRFRHFKNDSLDASSLSNNFVQGIYEDSNGRVFVSTMNDLDVFDPTNQTFNRFDPDNLAGIRRSIVVKDSDNTLWIGSANGLYRYDKNGVFQAHYTTENGLPDDNVTGILEDDEDNLWISTHNGIVKFEGALKSIISQPSFRSFSVQEGLQGAEFKTGSYLRDMDGIMYFGGQNGYNSFDPASIVEDPNVPPVIITKLKIFNKDIDFGEGELLPKPILELEGIELTYKESVFTIEFSALGFSLPAANTYAFKLDGFEDAWNYVGNVRTATYTNLDHGDYVFRVKAANSDGVWNEEGASLRITVLPPFYQTSWFRVSTLILLIGFAFVFYKYRTMRLEKAKRDLELKVLQRTHELEKKNEELALVSEEKVIAQQKMWQSEKMAALGFLLAGVGHEINNPLGFIKGGVEALKKVVDRDNKEVKKLMKVINEGVGRTTTIVKSLSHFSRTTSKTDERFDLHDIINNCLVLQENNLKHKVVVKKNFMKDTAMIEGNEGRMHQAILNLIANAEQAIENQGEIHISTAISSNGIELKISDTGTGIDAQNLPHIMDPFFTTKDPGIGTGLGLSITHNIIEEHLGTMVVESEKDKGTTFVLEFPQIK